jgi:flagellar biosynthesis/type III secretory pathway protein FliH
METTFGHVDARLESRLEKVTTAVKEAFEASHGPNMTEQKS